ncbi:hypothetical protein BD770DRAFT_401704 [Pilaira anomala]|nr:hypothetical protein BD770DRAFT_401704 [Pilaira anomala]
MTALGSFTTLITSAKPFVAKSLGPLSSNVIRQQQPQHNNYSTKPVITESAILNSFPRPNLEPTLQSSNKSSLHMLKTRNTLSSCNNCSGPHSTDFCPC